MPLPRGPVPKAVLAATLTFAFPIASSFAGIGDLKGTRPGDLTNPDSFANADGCDNCHGGGYMGDDTYLPSDSWAGTMMANAARDPVFFAALTVANQDAPGVGTFCLRCHSPIGFVRGHATPPDGTAFDEVDRQGIGCETCHRARHATGEPTPYLLGDAQLFYDDVLAKHGPYVACDPDAPAPGCANSNAHELAQDPELGTSAFCGQCHQVTNPDRLLRDDAGMETTFAFPLDTTYEEWERSAFATAGPDARSCQDCHMIRKAGSWPNVKGFGGAKRTDPRTHGFAGGNLWGIDAVMAANPERATTYARAFEVAKDATRAMLASAVKVTLEDAPMTLEPARDYEVGVRVENLGGHKFPTGYAESRRAWIALVVVGPTGEETFFTGAYDDDTGEIAASPEPRVYRAVHGVWNGAEAEAAEHLVLHDAIVSDTRIPPRGFSSSPTTTPKGSIDFGPDGDTYRNFDVARFTVRTPDVLEGQIRIEARVMYQSMTRDHVAFLREANVTDARGDDLFALYEATGRAAPLAIAVDARTFDFATPTSGSSAGTGSTSGGAGDVVPSGGSCACGVAAGDTAPWCAAGVIAAALAVAAGRRRTRARPVDG